MESKSFHKTIAVLSDDNGTGIRAGSISSFQSHGLKITRNYF